MNEITWPKNGTPAPALLWRSGRCKVCKQQLAVSLWLSAKTAANETIIVSGLPTSVGATAYIFTVNWTADRFQGHQTVP